MKRRLLLISLLLTLSLLIASSVLAQSYYFSLDKSIVHVYWNEDGSMSLEYTFFFTNQPGASAIDFVDVGLPNSYFNINAISATVNGKTVNISSDYQGDGCCGFAIELGTQAIPAGRSGEVKVFVPGIRNVLHTDTTDETYASAVFGTTYFGSQYMTGSTDVTVIFHLPPGVQPDEPRWHSAPSGFPSEPQTALDGTGRITYTWRNPNANGYTPYTFGASFPKTYVPESAIYTPPPFDIRGFIDSLMNFICCAGFAGLFFGIPALSVISERKRKLKYLPPKISIEGHGIKRGLTAVEAAILMEQPLDKVMTMILFGVTKKGVARVLKQDPLKLEALHTETEGLRGYEKEFLVAFTDSVNASQRRKLLQAMTVNLIKSVQEKIKGFSRKESIAYYENIMKRAWAQIEAAGTPEVKSEMYAEALEWTMLDKEYEDRTRRTFTGPIFVPTWWHRYDPTLRPASSLPKSAPPPPSPSVSGQPLSVPGSDFAASVVTGAQNFSSKVLGNVQDFTGRVTNVTNPVPKSTSKGGGACACACAGCACACAGGGR